MGVQPAAADTGSTGTIANSASTTQPARRFAVGAELVPAGGTHFRVWAPLIKRVLVLQEGLENGPEYALTSEGHGYHSGHIPELGAGARYRFRLDDEASTYPDPASRFQPDGPHGPSEVVAPAAFAWSDAGFSQAEEARVVYELHVGTFTAEGTYRAAAEQFAELAELGITVIELMPVADFPGRFGWGYDGVNLWAPSHLYGSPDDLRRLIDSAHAHGLAVILDVVYNHFGPDGNYLLAFSPHYFTKDRECEWGDAINFDGPESAPVREFFRENARYWVEEFHFDGLRLDATQAIFDDSTPHIITEIVRAARAAGDRLQKSIYIVAENEPQEARIVRPEQAGGYGVDALWNDDFHHSAMVALTGRHEAYYNDYRGSPQEFISALKWGYLFQGQHYYWQKNPRGQSALDLGAQQFVTYLQNHDQIANTLSGARIDRLTSAAELRAVTALMLLGPPTPMLFQGQEFASSAPFLFFADHEGDLASRVDADRRKFLAQFPSVATAEAQNQLAPAAARETFERCKLDFSERKAHAEIYRFHKDLLRLRREDPALRQRQADRLHGAVLSDKLLCLRFFCAQGDRLLLTNLGSDIELKPIAEPLLAPPSRRGWKPIWSSESIEYRGLSAGTPWENGKFILPARSTLLLAPVPIVP